MALGTHQVTRADLQLLVHMAHVRQCWGLLELVMPNVHEISVETVRNCVRQARLELRTVPNYGDILQDWQSHITLLTLEHSGMATQNNFGMSTSDEGPHMAFDVLREEVYGAAARAPLFELVYSQSFSQAALTLSACSLLLANYIIGLENCCALYSTARDLGIPDLGTAALLFIQEHFPDIVMLQPSQIETLAFHHLLHILSSNDIQVETELTVFNALACWTSADVGQRLSMMPQLLEEGCRLPLMTLEELCEVDAHPLVRSSSAATCLVARAYLSHCTDNFSATFLNSLRRSRPGLSYLRSPQQARADSHTIDDATFCHATCPMLSSGQSHNPCPAAGLSDAPGAVQASPTSLKCGDGQPALDQRTLHNGSVGQAEAAMPLCTSPRTEIPPMEAGSWMAGSPSRCQPTGRVSGAAGLLLSPTGRSRPSAVLGARQGVLRATRVLDWDSWNVDEEPPQKKNRDA